MYPVPVTGLVYLLMYPKDAYRMENSEDPY